MLRGGGIECFLDCGSDGEWRGEGSCSDNSLSFRLRLRTSASDILAKQVKDCNWKDLRDSVLRIHFGYNIKDRRSFVL